MNTKKKSKNISETCPGKGVRFLSTAVAVFFILLSSLAAADGSAESLEASYKQGLKSIEAWDVERAAAIARDLMERDSDNPRYRYLMAKVLFYKGDYARARETLAGVSERSGEDPHAAYLWEMINRTLRASESLTTFEEGNLLISLDAAKDSILIPYIKETMAEALGAIGKRLGYRPMKPLRIEVYPDTESFHLASSLTRRDIEVSGAVGICKFNKIMLISPRVLVRGYAWLDTLVHEYMHYVIVMLSADNAPVWFHEGAAKYYEKVWRSDNEFRLDPVPQALLARALENHSLITFQEMYPSLVKLKTAEEVQLAYAEAETAIALITSQAGDGGVRGSLLRMAREPGRDAMHVIESTLGLAHNDFTNHWMAFLKSMRLERNEGLEVLRHRVKGTFDSPDALDLREIKSEVSRNHLRLGDMLKNRGRISAAALEYKRALGENPYSPVILNRLGSSLAQMGSTDEGVEKLKTAEELYPDFGPTYKNLAEIYRGQNRLALSRGYYARAISINPFDPSLHAGLQAVLSAQGIADEAEREGTVLRKLLSRENGGNNLNKTHPGDSHE